VVADPGSVDIWRAWPESLRGLADSGTAAGVDAIWQNDVIPTLTPDEAFNLMKRGEIFGAEFLRQAREGKVPTNLSALASQVKQYALTDDVLARIKMPVLVTNYELEQFYPGQAQELYDRLRTSKDYVTFTTSQGAEYHCAPMAPQFRNEIVFNWLDDTVAKKK
jgi:hypothetical protein